MSAIAESRQQLRDGITLVFNRTLLVNAQPPANRLGESSIPAPGRLERLLKLHERLVVLDGSVTHRLARHDLRLMPSARSNARRARTDPSASGQQITQLT